MKFQEINGKGFQRDPWLKEIMNMNKIIFKFNI